MICAHNFAGVCALLLCAVSPSVRAAIHRALLTINTPARSARSMSHICTRLCSIICFLYRKNNRRGLVLVCDWDWSKKTGSLACNVDTTHAHTFLKYVVAFQYAHVWLLRFNCCATEDGTSDWHEKNLSRHPQDQSKSASKLVLLHSLASSRPLIHLYIGPEQAVADGSHCFIIIAFIVYLLYGKHRFGRPYISMHFQWGVSVALQSALHDIHEKNLWIEGKLHAF